MIRYVAKRLLWLIPTIICVTFLVMILLELTPGDPARQILGNFATEEDVEALRDSMGLNRPLFVRFGEYIIGIFTGNLGTSYFTKQPVWNVILIRFPYTLLLVVISMTLAVLIGIPIGVYAATHQYTWKDNAAIFLSLFCVSMPNFWFALLLVRLFAVKLNWLPSIGIDSWKSWVMPAFAACLGYAATLARQTRSSMLEQIRQDYVVTARAKGQTEQKVIYKHALKNALIPIIVIIGSVFGASLGGAVISETIFGIPGLGNYTLSALTSRDYPVVQGSVVYLAILYSIIMLVVDLVFAMLDPRIKSQYSGGKKKKKRQTNTEKEGEGASA